MFSEFFNLLFDSGSTNSLSESSSNLNPIPSSSFDEKESCTPSENFTISDERSSFLGSLFEMLIPDTGNHSFDRTNASSACCQYVDIGINPGETDNCN